MNKLIEFAKQNVPMRLWKTTPVHLQVRMCGRWCVEAHAGCTARPLLVSVLSRDPQPRLY